MLSCSCMPQRSTRAAQRHQAPMLTCRMHNARVLPTTPLTRALSIHHLPSLTKEISTPPCSTSPSWVAPAKSTTPATPTNAPARSSPAPNSSSRSLACVTRSAASCPVTPASRRRTWSAGSWRKSWVVVEASGFRQMAFARSNARPGESAFGAMLAFQAATVREATADERRDLAAGAS